MGLRLGIDTGGTYTDAVLYNPATRKVVAAAKALTTRHNLFLGLEAAFLGVLDTAQSIKPTDIELVAISTTLATNAVVESMRNPVGLVLIGFDEKAIARQGLGEALGSDPYVCLPGGHQAGGEQRAPLELSGLDEFDTSSLTAIAVVGRFAVRNPAHEREVAEHLRQKTSLPVTASHQLSAKLEGPRRAVTTLFNARLIPHIADLSQAVEKLMVEKGVNAPLMIVQGDGALVKASAAIARPVDTILSGPAASMIGAAHLLENDSALDRLCVSDIGGTTTDIGILEGGRPRLNQQGAVVGGFRTHVDAVEMATYGLGGDSEVGLGEGKLTLGPRRIEPLCVAANQFPMVLQSLKTQMTEARFDLVNARFLRRFREQPGWELPEPEAELWAAMADGPIDLRDWLRNYRFRKAVDALVVQGLALPIGFTPTDAAHVLGDQQTDHVEAAKIGAEIWAQPRDLDHYLGFESAEAFANAVYSLMTDRLTAVHMDAAHYFETGHALAKSSISDAVGEGKRGSLLHHSATLTMPIAGVGGPAELHYDRFATRLGTQSLRLDNSRVCNAVGAAVSIVVRKAECLITAPQEGILRVHMAESHQDISDDGEKARAIALDYASRCARQSALDAGALNPRLETEWDEKIVERPGSSPIFLEARVRVIASGLPTDQNHSEELLL